MSNDPQRNSSGAGADDLQFDRVETAMPPAGLGEPVAATTANPPATDAGVSVCAACAEPITDVYYEANGKVVCPRCREAVAASMAGGSGVVRVLGAVGLGLVAAAIGAAVWYAVRVYTDSEWSLIAIGIALLVGGAIRYATGGRGGRAYQLLAVILTYVSICSNYVPDVYRVMADSERGAGLPAPILLLSSFVFSLRLPFLMGVENILGILIIGIGLWVAWQSNRPNRITFNGPYRLAPTSAATGFKPPPPAAHA